ncbi:hypothetical protein Tco_1285470 [Tanacetum coccineum]
MCSMKKKFCAILSYRSIWNKKKSSKKREKERNNKVRSIRQSSGTWNQVSAIHPYSYHVLPLRDFCLGSLKKLLQHSFGGIACREVVRALNCEQGLKNKELLEGYKAQLVEELLEGYKTQLVEELLEGCLEFVRSIHLKRNLVHHTLTLEENLFWDFVSHVAFKASSSQEAFHEMMQQQLALDREANMEEIGNEAREMVNLLKAQTRNEDMKMLAINTEGIDLVDKAIIEEAKREF